MNSSESERDSKMFKVSNSDNFAEGLIFPRVITLNIGGRKFTVMTDTLCEGSGLFRKQLSGSYAWPPMADGSYFLDADPDLFEHLLRFMRRPTVFPLFYTLAQGFDHSLYDHLRVEAEFFQVDALHEWIKAKKYLTTLRVSIRCENRGEFSGVTTYFFDGIDRAEIQLVPATRSVHVCPRGIACHRDRPVYCGAACNKAKGNDEDKYEQETFLMPIRVSKEVCFIDTETSD